jgi:hypothetical protein
VWVPSIGGTEHSYEWIHNRRFLKYTTNDDSLTGIIGIDPRTDQVTSWCFYEQGGMSTSVIKQEQPDVWTIRLKGDGTTIRLHGVVVSGEVDLTMVVWRTGEDTTESQMWNLVVDGAELIGGEDDDLPNPRVTWKRRVPDR